jgi:hypothetical protein
MLVIESVALMPPGFVFIGSAMEMVSRQPY